MNTFIAIAGIVFASALQARMVTLWWLDGVRMELLPGLVVYVALTMHRGRAVALAFVAGLMQDSLSAAPFGVSALAYSVAAVLITGLREALDRDLPWIQLGAGALTSIAASIIPLFLVGVSFGALIRLLLVASISGVFTVILFFALDYSRMVWGDA